MSLSRKTKNDLDAFAIIWGTLMFFLNLFFKRL